VVQNLQKTEVVYNLSTQGMKFVVFSCYCSCISKDHDCWPILVIACSPLDAGQTEVMIDRCDKFTA